MNKSKSIFLVGLFWGFAYNAYAQDDSNDVFQDTIHYVQLYSNVYLFVDTTIFNVKPDTLVKYNIFYKGDGILYESYIFFNDSFNGKWIRKYYEDGNFYEYADYSANQYDAFNYADTSINIGLWQLYWFPGIINQIGYCDPKGRLQGNVISARLDGSIIENRIYKDNVLLKTYYYSETGELDSLVVH